MIPKLSEISPTQSKYLQFIERLKASSFQGETNLDYANRVVLSTDNSIYQVLPQGIIYPKSVEDIKLVTQLSNNPDFHDIVLSPRGGGTGTNGQSLSDGLIVDLSKHMNKILEINKEEGWARVQTGVVKDQLNRAAKQHGLFFAPELSTSNRATIGGMINTDASGQGSVMYGKTRDHVIELKTVLLDGSIIDSTTLKDESLDAIKSGDNRAAHIHKTIDAIHANKRDEIARKFPTLNRCLTGYDLAHIRDQNNQFNLNNILCGSEGTLGFIVEAKINLLAIPSVAALVNIRYSSFEHSLRHAQELLKANPTSIETVDSKVLNLAQNDIIWESVEPFFPSKANEDTQGINLVEYTGNSVEEVQAQIAKLTKTLETNSDQSSGVIGHTVAFGQDEVNKIWAMRKKSVGLLGNAKGEKRPIPFVEDTAVPPENLADFIMEFRAVLDSYSVQYGMFGHVDAGVLHVRPALDLKDESQEPMIREITDKVVALTQKYNGLLWGEHGKGVRSEYAPAFFGDLYPSIQEIKRAFDPRNQLNPGKIATPLKSDSQLLKIDEVPLRGKFDRTIPSKNREQFKEGMYCNGNGGCYNFDPNDAMCPSWKGTRERVHSPKGRASLMREWLRGMSEQGIDVVSESHKAKQKNAVFNFVPKLLNTLSKRRGDYDFSHEVHESMMGCLACKSCVGQCPIKVDVPEFRAKFLELYYARYLRPAKDYLIGSLEYVMPYASHFPTPYNWLISRSWTQHLTSKYLGFVDAPKFSKLNLKKESPRRGIRLATPLALEALSPKDRRRAVIIAQDAFTSYFETELVLDIMELLTRLGFQAFLAPYKPNGKPLHVHGFMKSFERTAKKNLDMLQGLRFFGIPIIGVDPSMTLTYRSEYEKTFGTSRKVPNIQLLQEWLATHTEHLNKRNIKFEEETIHLLGHCTEKTNAPSSIKHWQTIFSQFGLNLESVAVGCCGMAGTYGHESKNLETSKTIYGLSWKEAINNPAFSDSLVATGYSCRSQVKRIDDKNLPHPAQLLLTKLKAAE
ncbi:FAD-binding and (Fe-S)-binding domain-containing protein [Marinomonas mediterranea]|uniref:D-2-hydroxyglutarate dehydrogenase n=1 Tax=Marinomonas mediterranea (strain ATCC 700492 / JCM 21426 / NBRC 103028 / MMB-1) TaxID=717774 RepID=F2K3F3_MARM1|nr:FAD-binding and (Fe-S)-binding domain-containing protein [Marinomonas mediterranea]ADZ91295.1 D-lactate dehydrogenase (cytochrome) [Marinomonas mediterranea MMB-1]WCN09266.1 FAD-binding protein [Marinomonas mediterranea]WCN17416.1 FAD-binding protein [Marinomonas mediterranea MMB-1]